MAAGEQGERGTGRRHLPALCLTVAAVFVAAGLLVQRAAQDLLERAEDQLELELSDLRVATEWNLLDVVDDLEAMRIARDVSQQIEETMEYPGQIKVTVIRETRATEIAR